MQERLRKIMAVLKDRPVKRFEKNLLEAAITGAGSAYTDGVTADWKKELEMAGFKVEYKAIEPNRYGKECFTHVTIRW